MNSLSYKETLNIVEKFMIDSGIRQYCTKICKGRCCEGCFEKDQQACCHHEKRRLPCSAYLCYEMLDLFSAENKRRLESSHQSICEQYYSYYRLQCCSFGKSVYFTAPPKIFFEIVRFPMFIKTILEEVDTKKIKTTINKLIKENKQIYC